MALEVSKAALEAGFAELRTFSSMVDFAPRDEVDSALQKVFVAMYDKMFPATVAILDKMFPATPNAESKVDSGEAEA